jgi:hypothetical protein
VVSGWIVEQSTNSLPLTFWDFRAVSMVSVMALSSPTQAKMMSAAETASSMEVATFTLSDGSVSASFSLRAVVRL